MFPLILVVALAASSLNSDPDVMACKAGANVMADCQKVLLNPRMDAEHVASAWLNIGLAYDKGENDVAAMAAYDKAVQINPRYMQAWRERAALHHKLGDRQQAIADLTSALAIDPADPELLARRGTEYFLAGDNVRSYRDMNDAVARSSGKAEYLRYRGSIYANSGQLKLGRTDLEHSVKLDPQDALAWRFLGEARENLNDHKGALDAYEKALAIKAEPVTFLDRSISRSNLGDLEGAMADIDVAITLEPGWPKALYYRILYEMSRGRKDDALKDLDAYLQVAPSAEAYVRRGVLLIYSGKAARAVEDYDRALAIYPEYNDALLGRGAAYSFIGNFANAKADCKRGLELKQHGQGSFYELCTSIVTDPRYDFTVKQR